MYVVCLNVQKIFQYAQESCRKHNKHWRGEFIMQVSEPVKAAIKPALWGAAGGAIAAMIVGFVWVGWVTGGTARQMAQDAAQTEITLAFAPLCVARAEQNGEVIKRLHAAGAWQRANIIVEAGWVNNVSEKYRSAVARVCAATIVEAMEPPAS